MKFYINLDDYVDTGLFSDHRNTRQMVKDLAKGRRFLNLYCYTGSFSCYAAKGGARITVSVDRSDTAIQWAKENMRLNGLYVDSSFPADNNLNENEKDSLSDNIGVIDQKNIFIKAHTFDFLQKAKKKDNCLILLLLILHLFLQAGIQNTILILQMTTLPYSRQLLIL